MTSFDDSPPNSSFVISNENKSIKYYKQVIQISIHHYYLTDEIEEIDPYFDLINTLKTAEEHDTIYVNINSPGGCIYSTVQIINAIRNSSGTVITVLDGMAASAATLIFLSGHKCIVNDNCSFMCHSYSQSVPFSKSSDLIAHVEYQKNYFKKLAEDIYKNFLTKEELTDMLNGKDFWFSSDEVLKRLEPKVVDKKIKIKKKK